KIRKCFEEIDKKRELIDEVESVADELDVEFPEAYQIVLERRKQRETLSEEEGDPGFEFFNEFADRQSEESEFESEFFNFEAEERKKGSASSVTADILKQLYRDLARLLHPDTGAAQDERTRGLWLEVQQAYTEQDLPRLKALSALC